MPGQIRQGILRQIDKAICPGRNIAWRDQLIDWDYVPSNPAGNLLKGKGLIISCYGDTTVSLDNRDQRVSIVYIFALAVNIHNVSQGSII